MIRNRNLIFGKATGDSRDEDKYIQLPEIATSDLPTPASDNEGGIAYDTTTNALKISNGSSWVLQYLAGGTDIPVADGGTGASTASAARTNLGLAIGTDVEGWDVVLDKIKTKSATALADADATLTAAQLLGGLFTITPTVARTLTTDTAANIVAALSGYQVGSWFDFTVVVLAAYDVTLAGGTGVTIVGSAVGNNNSATFKARIDSATAVTIYRL